MFGEHSTIQLYKAKKSDLTNQVTFNSLTLRLKQKHSANDVNEIHHKYGREEEMIRNEMKGLDDKTGNEYFELMSELQELKDEEDREVTQAEEASKEYETQIELENASLETQIQAIAADIEGLEEMRKENIEKVFGYFQ